MGTGGGSSGLSAGRGGRNLGATKGSGYETVTAGLKSGALIRDRATGQIVTNKDNSDIFYDEVTQTSYRINFVFYSETPGRGIANMDVFLNGKWEHIKNSSIASEHIGTLIRKKGNHNYKIVR